MAGQMDVTFSTVSLNTFAAYSREGHIKRAIKIYGYRKKYPKKGNTIDPRDPILYILISRK